MQNGDEATPSGWQYEPGLTALAGLGTLNGTAWGTLTALDLVTR